VQRIEGKIAQVLRHPDGDIAALKLADGSLLEADLFVDCTGMRGLLLGDTLGVKLEDWSHWLPCDRAVAVQTQSVQPAVPYVRSIAHPFGWQWQIPLQHRVGNGMVYSSRHVSDDEALATLLGNVQGEVLTKPRVIPFKACQRETVWERNCVAIGLSSGFLEPLESTSIHLIQRGIIRLLQCFPNEGVRQVDIDEYNCQTRDEMEHIRDFIILHYKVTERADSPFWNHCRTMEVPASLQHRIALFRESARVFRAPNELFAENSWIQVMLGQGIQPGQHHAIANLMDDTELNGFLEEIRGRVDRTVAQLPPHADYVARYCQRPGQPAQPMPAAA
jgi:tryptophan 7-halogenase